MAEDITYEPSPNPKVRDQVELHERPIEITLSLAPEFQQGVRERSCVEAVN